MQIDPYNVWVAVTPSDSVDLPALTEAIWAGGAGVIAAVEQDGQVVNFTCVAGTLVPIKARRINSTNTTATALVALYRQ